MGKKKNQSNLFNHSSPMKIVRVCKAMVPAQRDLITGSKFGDMLGMKCSKLIPELCRFLMGCFDPTSCVLDFGDRGRIPVTDESIVRVMGVPTGNTPVAYQLDVDATNLILDMFGIEDGVQPNVSRVEKVLGPGYPADDAYLRKFMIYVMSSVFAPTTGIKILYVDSLETHALDVLEDGTRSCIWTNKMIKLVADLDTNSDGSFGRLPLKACFRVKLSLFIAEPADVDMFIRRHLPGNHKDEDLVKYRDAVINMYNVFEARLATFITSLSVSDDKATTNKHVEEKDGEYRKKPKRRRTGHAKTETVQVRKDDEVKEDGMATRAETDAVLVAKETTGNEMAEDVASKEQEDTEMAEDVASKEPEEDTEMLCPDPAALQHNDDLAEVNILPTVLLFPCIFSG